MQKSLKTHFFFFFFCLLLLGHFAFTQDGGITITIEDEEEALHTCEDTPCRSDLYPTQSTDYNPVCGIPRDEAQGDPEQTFDNVCKLCEEGKYLQFTSGPCQHDRSSCPQDSDSDTPLPSEGPVCAYFTTEDFGSVYSTVPTGTVLCADEAVEYWTEGECGPMEDHITYCLPNSRPEACTEEYNPVCGFSKDENGYGSHKIMSNACAACGATEILYHTPGPCVLYCEQDFEIVYVCSEVPTPICATYEENGEGRNVSMWGECSACSSSEKPISFTEGLCPGDEGIRCENDDGTFDEGFLNPVCGYSAEDCNEDSCRKTYPEPSLACSDGTVWYSLEACPGDIGVSCDGYRTKPQDEPVLYAEVCGFTTEDCDDDSCRDDYADQYEACADSNVLYFTKGPCVVE